jgi:hypothetical protein
MLMNPRERFACFSIFVRVRIVWFFLSSAASTMSAEDELEEYTESAVQHDDAEAEQKKYAPS